MHRLLASTVVITFLAGAVHLTCLVTCGSAAPIAEAADCHSAVPSGPALEDGLDHCQTDGARVNPAAKRTEPVSTQMAGIAVTRAVPIIANDATVSTVQFASSLPDPPPPLLISLRI